MSGIVAYVGPRDCPSILVQGLEHHEQRGYDSVGVAIYDGSAIQRVRTSEKLTSLANTLQQQQIHGTIGLAHTRWATHGAPTEANAHPHIVDGIVVVHNGIIENHAQVRTQLQKDGATFTSDTDTEVIAHLVARSPQRATSLAAALRDALSQLRGSYAIAVFDTQRPTSIVGTANAAPLLVGVGEHERFLVSDAVSILAHTRQAIYLEDGDIAEIQADGLTITNANGEVITRETTEITWDPITAEKDGYPHFMMKEIHEQPQSTRNAMRGRISDDKQHVQFDELTMDHAWIRNISQVIFLACGTSYHAGLVAAHALEQRCKVHVRCELASEFRSMDPLVDDRTLVVPISQSGETADTLAATRIALAKGARAITVCNVTESSLGRLSEGVLGIYAGPEIGVASTKAFTAQLTVLMLFAIWLGEIRGTLSAETRMQWIQALEKIPSQMETALASEDAIAAFAKSYSDVSSFLFLGRGYQYPIAKEGSLKLKEISYIHAEGYASGELKHGPIALIDETMPVVVLVPDDSGFEKTLSSIEEVRARGARVVAIGSGNTQGELDRVAENTIMVPATLDVLQPLLTVIPLQLLAYYIADARGLDIDQPRYLAKSVTVE